MNGLDLIRSPSARTPGVYPRGWYALAFSDELHPRDLKTIRFLGREYVLWRTASGEACAMEAYCPHLGAHLGHGGEVVGEAIRCPMHHFRFATDGSCESSGYGCQSAPRSVARTLIVVEHAGFVFAHHDPVGALPPLDNPPRGTVSEQHFRVSASIAELAANAAELQRLGGTAVAPPAIGDRVLRLRHRMHFDTGCFGQLPGNRVDLAVELHGLGLAVMDLVATPGDVRTRLVFALTPAGANEVDVRVRTWTHDERPCGVSWLFPRQLQRLLVQWMLAPQLTPAGETFQSWARQFATESAPGPQEVLSQDSCA